MTNAPVIDPVCLASLTRWDRTLDRRYAKVVYRFCSTACADRFAEAPAAYAAPTAGPPEQARVRERVTLPILGLGCGGGGASSIERALQRLPGVLYAYVNPATEMAYVEYHPDLVTYADLVSVIEDQGYRSLSEREDRRQRQSGRGESR